MQPKQLLHVNENENRNENRNKNKLIIMQNELEIRAL